MNAQIPDESANASSHPMVNQRARISNGSAETKYMRKRLLTSKRLAESEGNAMVKMHVTGSAGGWQKRVAVGGRAIPVAFSASLLLAACASPSEPKIVTREVQVPVAVKCASDPGPQPAYADSDAALKAAPDLYERVKLLVAGRLQRIAREAELIAANSGCR